MNNHKNISHRNSPNIVDILLSRKTDSLLDSDSLLKNVQNRINDSLEKGYQYQRVTDSSENYLRGRAFEQINMAVLYVDLVNSTKLSMRLSSDKLSTLISSFSQEMAYVINTHNGYVLKFVGDAVIGYFPEDKMSQFNAVENSVGCAESMMKVVKEGINPILVEKVGLPEISIRIGIDFGKNVIVRYGADPKRAFVDLLGPTMNVASKIQGLSKPNQILVGQEIQKRLHPNIQDFFYDITESLGKRWYQVLDHSDSPYHVYKYRYQNRGT